MVMPNPHVDKESNISREEHGKWMEHIRQEFKVLLDQKDLDFSPCSSWRESRRIWVTERGRVPLLERQEGFNRNENFNCEI